METSTESTVYRYDAFISYRHVEPDRKWAKWLHGALETYRVPRELVAKGFPKRLTRVFRDEEELPANADLSTQITTALDESKFLIVICSPRAPLSKWVNAEVEHFRKLGRHDKILALLIEGEPRESFPAALTEIRRSVVDAGTGQTREQIEEVEPLAADVRPERSDTKAHTLRSHARLRLMACMLGCRFDDLRQREAERRVKRTRVVAAGLAGLVVMLGGLTGYAFVQRAEAVRQEQAASSYAKLVSEDMVELAAADEQDAAAANVLVRAAQQIPERFRERPDLVVDVSIQFGEVLMRAGRPYEAEALYKQAKDEGTKLKMDAGKMLQIEQWLNDARLRTSVDDSEFEAARGLIQQATRERGARDVTVMAVRNVFAGRLKNASPETAANLDEAEKMYQSVLADRTAVLGAQDVDTLVTRHNLAIIDLKRCRTAYRALGESPSAEATAAVRDQYRAAVTARRAVTADTRAALGDDHPQTLATWSEEVGLLAEAGRVEPALLVEAVAAYPRMLDALRTRLGFASWRALMMTGRYGQALTWAGENDRAIQEWRIAVESLRSAFGVDYPLALQATDALVKLLEAKPELGQAESLLLRSHQDAVDKGNGTVAAQRAAAVRGFYERQGRAADVEKWKDR